MLDPPPAACAPERADADGIGLTGAAPTGAGAPTGGAIGVPSFTWTGIGGGPPGFAPCASSVANAPEGRRTAIPAPAFATEPGATPLC